MLLSSKSSYVALKSQHLDNIRKRNKREETWTIGRNVTRLLHVFTRLGFSRDVLLEFELPKGRPKNPVAVSFLRVKVGLLLECSMWPKYRPKSCRLVCGKLYLSLQVVLI